MSSALRALPVATNVAPAPGWRGFLRSVVHRVTWKAVLIGATTSWLLSQVREIGQSFHTPVSFHPMEFWRADVVIVASETICLLLAILAADEAVERGAPRLRSYTIAVAVGATLGGLVQGAIRAAFDLQVGMSDEEFLIRITQPLLVSIDFAILGGLTTFVYVNLRTARQAATRRRAAEIARLEARRRTLESRLQAMQARVEPQFLFNTLAQVRELYESDAALSGKMLDDLIAYLRAALPHLRETSSTLGKEAALARAYLEIVRVRLGERLAFDLSIPDALADARLPPMMLLPLIDHALVYGLEPSQDGGTIRIDTEAGSGRLRLAITDSGAGFVPGRNARDLDSIGERLSALYGDDATFRLQRVQDRGTQAILEIPYEPADRSDR